MLFDEELVEIASPLEQLFILRDLLVISCLNDLL